MDNNSLTSVISQYINRGFGSMTKNDFEVWIFNKWLSFGENRVKSDYAISRELRIPVSKVKRLRYESSLIYSDTNDVDLKNTFCNDLQKAKYKADSQKLYFLIPNKLVRQYVNDILEKDGRYMESSLTSSSVSIFINDFIYLIEELKLIDKEQIIQKAKEESKKNVGFPLEWNEIVKEFLVNCAKDKLGEFTADTIVKGISDVKEKIKVTSIN